MSVLIGDGPASFIPPMRLPVDGAVSVLWRAECQRSLYDLAEPGPGFTERSMIGSTDAAEPIYGVVCDGLR